MDVAIAPDRVRIKFINPAAELVSSSSTLPSAAAVDGIKKKGMPRPSNINGSETSQ